MAPQNAHIADPIDYFGISVPFMQYLGLQPEVIDEDYSRTRLTLRPELTNSRGDMHGGTVMSVFDFTLSAAARSHAPHTTGVMTIEMSTHFMDAVTGDVVIEARCLRRGRSIAFCEGTIRRADDTRVLAVARATFKLIARKTD
ncbi:PaaI family thioesterase [Achromobacter sp. GG226]|uniref:PaaI family thioesterase n=1 Tax=Verticiella alkaliphila TaxID=2779529 RepID=UPI001C0C7444|nr:PaaI family thioesterase [Verticiella sp. GG226]MBU4609071.1 PaaI family thioesterase [Verticiella sp. GG226]